MIFPSWIVDSAVIQVSGNKVAVIIVLIRLEDHDPVIVVAKFFLVESHEPFYGVFSFIRSLFYAFIKDVTVYSQILGHPQPAERIIVACFMKHPAISACLVISNDRFVPVAVAVKMAINLLPFLIEAAVNDIGFELRLIIDIVMVKNQPDLLAVLIEKLLLTYAIVTGRPPVSVDTVIKIDEMLEPFRFRFLLRSLCWGKGRIPGTIV